MRNDGNFKTRGCLLVNGGIVISSKENENGDIINETIRFKKKKGSTPRAVMHGVFDVATMGLWEIVGTPIEGHVGKDEMFVLDIYYDKDGNIKKAELVQ